MSQHILVIEDDALLAQSLVVSLKQAGYQVTHFSSAEDALAAIPTPKPGLALMDIGLPGMDGLTALPYFKNDLGIPVIFLTARRKEIDEVMGLEMGADDYITKPFDLMVLLARVKAFFRHTEQSVSQQDSSDSSTLIIGDLEINVLEHTVKIAGKVVELTPREFDLLHTFALHPHQVLSIDDLIVKVWGAEFLGEPQVVYVHVRWLREKIEEAPDHPQRILNVRGVGYRFEPREA